MNKTNTTFVTTTSYNKLTRAETGLTVLGLLTTFRISLLPSLLAQSVGDSAFWVALLTVLGDSVLTFVALWLAAKGGLRALPIPSAVKRVLTGGLALFCWFKVAVYLFEVADYCRSEMFDNATAWPIALILVLCITLLAAKGFRGVARTGMVCAAVSLLLLVLALFFMSFNGFGYNLYPLLRPQSVGKGWWQSLLWCGDGAVLALADIREEKPTFVRRMRWSVLAMVMSVVGVGIFYALFVYTFGSSGRYVRYAFARMLMNSTSGELGALDWPIVMIWLISAILLLSVLMYGGCEGMRHTVGDASHGSTWGPVVGALLTFGGYLALGWYKDGLQILRNSWLCSAVCMLLSYVVIAVAAVWCAVQLIKNKKDVGAKSRDGTDINTDSRPAPKEENA